MKELKLEDGNIVAVVEWTPRGAEYLKNKEYRYLSPVVNVRKMDNKAIGLHSLALTNTPAIENMTPIVNSDNFEGGHENMDMQKLAAALGLGPDATEEQIMEALQAMVAENKSLKEGKQPGDEATVANKAVCELLGLKAGAPAEDVTAKIMELKGGTIDGVNVLEELKALKQQKRPAGRGRGRHPGPESGQDHPGAEGLGPELRSGRPQGLRRVCGEGPPGRPHGRDRPGRHRGPQIRQAGRGDHVGLQAAGRQPGRPGEIREGGVSHYGSFD